jgi:hypothetical protein
VVKYLFKGGGTGRSLRGERRSCGSYWQGRTGMDLIKVPVKDGKHYSYPNDVILRDYQVYVRRTGDV